MILTDGVCTGCPATFVKGGPSIWEAPMSDPYGEYQAAVNRAMKEIQQHERDERRRSRQSTFQRNAYILMRLGRHRGMMRRKKEGGGGQR